MATPVRTPWLVLLAAFLMAAFAAACAPAANGPVSITEGVDAGNTSPPFAMALEDGSQVTLKNIVDGNKAVHLFWFATW